MDSLKDYLHILGKIHLRNGIQNAEMLVMGPHFVASAVRYLPSTLRERRIQESWLRFLSVINELMNQNYPMVTELSIAFEPEEKRLITTSSQQLLQIQKQWGIERIAKKLRKAWSKEQGKVL